MAFNQSQNDDEIVSEINLTPLIDIMLVLLIIFMVTSSVSLESGLDIDLPKTSSETSSGDPNAVIISMNSSGGIFVQGNEVADLSNLETEIRLALEQEGTKLVILEGDKASTLESAIDIMDTAKKAGAEKFAIAAEGT